MSSARTCWANGLLALVLCVADTNVSATEPAPKSPPPDVPKYAPLSGLTGYQEIKLPDDSWYVGFHGERKHSMDLVETGWAARAAQLCMSLQLPYFVELHYVGEAILAPAPGPAHVTPSAPVRDGSARTVGYVYIPIFIPQPQGPMPTVLTPSKAAAVRCVPSPDRLIDPSRARTATDALDAARKRGLAVP